MEKKGRYESIHIRLSKKEKELFEEKFRLSGFKTKSNFVLYIMHKTNITNLNYDMAIFKDINFNLAQIGNNINQVARKVNMNNVALKEDLEEIQKLNNDVNEIKKVIFEIYNKLNSVKHKMKR